MGRRSLIESSEPMDVRDHPANNIPNATQHYAGDVIYPRGAFSYLGDVGPTKESGPYQSGQKSDPKIQPLIPAPRFPANDNKQ